MKKCLHIERWWGYANDEDTWKGYVTSMPTVNHFRLRWHIIVRATLWKISEIQQILQESFFHKKMHSTV